MKLMEEEFGFIDGLFCVMSPCVCSLHTRKEGEGAFTEVGRGFLSKP